MKRLLILVLVCAMHELHAQELFVFTEPASNMPSKSISAKFSSQLVKDLHRSGTGQRYIPAVMFGLNKKWMAHAGATFSDMYSSNLRWESVYSYAKYRFLSVDDVHKHFRMAAFAEASYSRNPYMVDEVSILGDKSGVQVGIVATQLWNKLAISGTVSHTQSLDDSRYDKVYYDPRRNYQAMNYALSAGLLLLPREYTSYKQTNLNFYTEFLVQQSLDRHTYYADLAPAIQFIFNSNTLLNIGYRFQLGGNINRMSEKGYYVSFERIFLNALRKKKD